MSNNDRIELSIVTPSGAEYEGDIVEGVFPGEDGDLGILPDHTPLLSILRVGIIKIKEQKESNYKVFATSGGYIEVKDNVITLLAETAESREKLDKARAVEAKDRAEERIRQAKTKSGKDIDIERAEASLKRALTRLELV